MKLPSGEVVTVSVNIRPPNQNKKPLSQFTSVNVLMHAIVFITTQKKMRNKLLQDKRTFRKSKNRMFHHHLTVFITLLAIAVLDRMVVISDL